MFTSDDPDRFIVGANLPWVGYGTDIGASAWYPDGGLSAQPAALDRLERTFARLERDGISIVRTFLLCDARSGVRFDDAGMPLGLDDAVFPDLDTLVAAARRHGIHLMPALLDFHLCKAATIVNDVQLGGRSHVIENPEARTAFIDLVLRPIAERYRDDDAVMAWDVMNEPEWCLASGIGFVALQDFLREAFGCMRASANQPVTVGCAGIDGLDLVRPIGLDFYQVHWYEKFGWPALARPVRALDLNDRSVVLGEFPGRSPFVADILETAKRAGYAGALAWSVLTDDA
jgi:cellulase (glycosyl hydrolase family 5)